MPSKALLLWVVLTTALCQGCGSTPAPSSAPDGGANMPAATGGKAGLPNAEAPQPAPPPDFTFDAKDYPAEYEKNQDKTIQKYIGKRVEVTGIVRSVGRDGNGGYLDIGEPDAERFAVRCATTDLEPWKFALPGQSVRVRGTVSFPGPALQLGKCQVVSATGPAPPTMTADEFTREFKNDLDGLNKRCGKKDIIVTGEIEAVEHRDGGAAIATLTRKGSTPELKCYFLNFVPADQDRNRKLAKGQKVKVLGNYPGGKSCAIDFCNLMSVTP